MLEAKLEKRGKKEMLRIHEEPLLAAVIEGEGGEPEYELERRYRPAKLLPQKFLDKFRQYDIAQGYLRAAADDGNQQRFRLRSIKERNKTTYIVERKISPKETRKLGIVEEEFFRDEKGRKVTRRGKFEQRIEFSPEDSDTEDFARLLREHVPHKEITQKTRYVIPHRLGNGNMCEIHYDIHHGRDMEGIVRIEVEFHRAHAEQDERYVFKHGVAKTLPSWIGEDVTLDDRYGGSSIAKRGFPAEARLLMEELAEKDRSMQL